MLTKPKKRYKYTTIRQWGGNDGYQWAIFYKDRPNVPIVCGLTRPEIPSYRDRFELEEKQRVENSGVKSQKSGGPQNA